VKTSVLASCSSHVLCSNNLTWGSISSVYPDSVNGQDILLIVSSSSFRPIPLSFVTSLHSGMILDNKVPTTSQLAWRCKVGRSMLLCQVKMKLQQTSPSTALYTRSSPSSTSRLMVCRGSVDSLATLDMHTNCCGSYIGGHAISMAICACII
jgi:hypothetical protein